MSNVVSRSSQFYAGYRMSYQRTIRKQKIVMKMCYNMISICKCQFNHHNIYKPIILSSAISSTMVSNDKFIFKNIIVCPSLATLLNKYLKPFDAECSKYMFAHTTTQNIHTHLEKVSYIKPSKIWFD